MFIEPVFGKKFFGREQVIATLEKRVSSVKSGYRQNLALVGPMLVGKSSILRHFLKNIQDKDIIPVYIDMGAEDFSLFAMRFMATLLYQYLDTEGEKAHSDLISLEIACRKRIPKTVCRIDSICKIMKQKKYDEAYEMLLDLTSVFKSETGKSCVVVLDEFHNLANFHLKRPFQSFGKAIMLQKNTMYIVSSSQKTILREILTKKLSLLFGNFEIIDIDGFDDETSRAFIADKTHDTAVPEDIKSYIIQISHGNPFYLETMLKQFSVIQKTKGGYQDAKECLLDAIAMLLYESGGLLNQYFTNNMNFFLEKKNRKKFIPILIALSKGNSKIKAIQKALGKSDKDLGADIAALVEMDLVHKSGVFCKIDDRLFEFWLKNVYHLKSGAVVDDLDIRYLEFKKLLQEDFDAYHEFSSKDIKSVLTELFYSFKDEKVLIGMHERILPVFSDIKWEQLSENVMCLKGRTGNNTWLCHVKSNDIMDEKDVIALDDIKSKNEGLKITRKILVPLHGIEHNASLLAKENNMWIWDPKQLNVILRLFGKFELVL